MAKFYSKTTNSFYASDIHGDNKPSDCIEISEEFWQELVNGLSQGKVIKVDDNGNPYVAEPPPLTEEQKIDIANSYRQQAYYKEADALFFKSQRGEIDKQVWLDKVAEIKARFPK